MGEREGGLENSKEGGRAGSEGEGTQAMDREQERSTEGV